MKGAEWISDTMLKIVSLSPRRREERWDEKTFKELMAESTPM